MKKIKLTKGKFALVDDEDFEYLNQFKWQLGTKNYPIHTQTFPIRKTIRMHQFLLKVPNGMQADHKDGNELNNQRNNLRLATYSQNAYNRKIRIDNSSGFKGVTWMKKYKRWMAYIWSNKKMIYLGCFKNKSDAIKIRKQATMQYHGEYARL